MQKDRYDLPTIEKRDRRFKDGRPHEAVETSARPCPQRVTDVEEAAEKAHVDLAALEQARADLGVVTSRANAGGVQAVQWSLPAS